MEKNVKDLMLVLSKKIAEIESHYFKSEIEEFSKNGYGYCSHGITSPIEQLLFISLLYLVKIENLKMADPEQIGDFIVVQGINIQPQYKIEKYRIDFSISNNKNIYSKSKDQIIVDETNQILVECDSQEWHERTEKERRYEKQRDRIILKNNLKLFHYTGKEIIENPIKVASEILTEVVGYTVSDD